MSRKTLIAGNWKMNGSRAANAALVRNIRSGLSDMHAEIVLCPPAVYLESVAQSVAGSEIGLGAQNLSDQTKPGAFTGEIHGAMLVDVGCRYVIVGHSERRALFGEDDAMVARKVVAALTFDLIPILCLGESLQERETGVTECVLARQLRAVLDSCGIEAFRRTVIAYEPVWAIGTGRTASPEQAQQAHAFLRSQLAHADATIAGSTRLLYGGSVKPENSASLFACPDIDGGLIGGASLKASDFISIATANATH